MRTIIINSGEEIRMMIPLIRRIILIEIDEINGDNDSYTMPHIMVTILLITIIM